MLVCYVISNCLSGKNICTCFRNLKPWPVSNILSHSSTISHSTLQSEMIHVNFWGGECQLQNTTNSDTWTLWISLQFAFMLKYLFRFTWHGFSSSFCSSFIGVVTMTSHFLITAEDFISVSGDPIVRPRPSPSRSHSRVIWREKYVITRSFQNRDYVSDR